MNSFISSKPKAIKFIIIPINNLKIVSSILFKLINKYNIEISPNTLDNTIFNVVVFSFNIFDVDFSIKKSIMKFNNISSSMYIISSPRSVYKKRRVNFVELLLFFSFLCQF